MHCQICENNEATIHLTEISEGVRTEMHLCEHCAVEQGIAVKSQMSVNELLGNLLASAPEDEEIANQLETKACPQCGFTLDKFRKEAVLGCPYDYEVFKESLTMLIEKAHEGKKTHCGKVPSKLPTDIKKQATLLKMRQELEDAIKVEDYELAAKLRDKISTDEKKEDSRP